MQDRIPLERRLQDAAIHKPGCPAACFLDTGTYFYALSEMGNDTDYKMFYQFAVMNGDYDGIEDTFIAQVITQALAGAFPDEKAEALLHAILIRPFADGNLWGEGGGNT